MPVYDVFKSGDNRSINCPHARGLPSPGRRSVEEVVRIMAGWADLQGLHELFRPLWDGTNG